MGISAFGIIFAMCCSVCAGVRHYKHGERKDKLMPEGGNDTMGNLNAKMWLIDQKKIYFNIISIVKFISFFT